MAERLTPLTCNACGGAVPLVASASTACPYCKATVEIPAAHRALLAAEGVVDAERREGQALAQALARVPSAPVRMLAMFDSSTFLLFGLGFWIVAGVFVGVIVPPWIGRWFGVSTIDVLDERTQGALSMVVPLGTFALGLLGAGWARKRAIVRGGLQTALAARAPERPGGPERCRQCGAALAITARDHALQCPYCGTDNLVNVPPAWLAGMRRHAKALAREVAAARRQFDDERRALRSSLIVRAIVGAAIVGLPATCVLGAAPERDTMPIEYAAGPPRALPSWREHRERSVPAIGLCSPQAIRFAGFTTRADDCDAEGCRFHRLVPLARGESLRVIGPEAPERTKALLQIHERTFLDDRWTTIADGAVADTPVLRAPLSAWYRLTFLLPGGQAGALVRACVERHD